MRELQSTIERLVVLAMVDKLEPRHLALVDEELMPPTNGAGAASGGSNGVRQPVELCGIDELVHRHVDAVLAHTEGNKARAAKILGIDLSTLYRWQQKWQT